jgi:hypothetical protein
MTNLPSTAALCRLRRLVVAGAEPFVGELREHRSRFQAAVLAITKGDDENVQFNRCWEAWLGAWKYLATLGSQHEFFVRPLFREKAVEDLLRIEMQKCLQLERLRHNNGPGIGGTGHRALGGALGVGKTYIMRGIALLTAALCAAATPVTFNYEASGANVSSSSPVPQLREALVPIAVLLDAFAVCHDGTESDAEDTIRRLSRDTADEAVSRNAADVSVQHFAARGLFPVLLLDEVNTWYRTDAFVERGKSLAYQLQNFGRKPNVLALLSGSSSCLREQLYAQRAWVGYPSLNSSLFRVQEVAPLRDATRLAQFVATVGFALPHGMTPAQLLSLSGGVGRAIEKVCGGERDLQGKLHPRELLMKEQAFTLLMSAVLREQVNARRLAEGAGYPQPLSITETAALELLKRAGYDDGAIDTLLRWRDNGVLYLRADAEPLAALELLYPYHAVAIQQHLEQPLNQCVANVLTQLHGVDGSLGHALERLCRPQLSFLFEGASQRHGKLKIVGKQARYVGADGDDAAPFDPVLHFGEIIEWLKQIGLEDFVLNRGGGQVVYIDGWQCKAPEVGKLAKWGKLDAAAAAVARTKTVASLDPITYLSHAVVKAWWGFCDLARLLHAAQAALPAAGQALEFRPRHLYVRTTAVLDAGCEAQVLSLPDLRFPSALVDACEGCPAYVKECSIILRVEDGVEWIDTLVPASHSGTVTSRALTKRCEAARTKVAEVAARLEQGRGVGGGGAESP